MKVEARLFAVPGILFWASFCAAAACAGDKISVQTVYLHNPIERFHRITIIGELGGQGTLILDPNECKINEFGDPVVCTVMGRTVLKVSIKEAKKPDPSGLGRKLYCLEGPGLAKSFQLLVWPGNGRPPRLIYRPSPEKPPVPVTLEPVDSSGDGVPGGPLEELCRGKYVARRLGRTVVVTAKGSHKTSGYHTEFRIITIFSCHPHLELTHTKLPGPADPVESPFVTHVFLGAKEKMDKVIVHDADGRHEVPVRQGREQN